MKLYFEESLSAQFYSKYILIVTSFINDSFKLPVCLNYEPLLIFLACVYLVEIYFKIQLKDKAGKKWFQLINGRVEFRIIEELSAKIKLIYDYSNSNRTAHSSSGSLNLLGPKGEKAQEGNRFVIDFEPSLAEERQGDEVEMDDGKVKDGSKSENEIGGNNNNSNHLNVKVAIRTINDQKSFVVEQNSNFNKSNFYNENQNINKSDENQNVISYYLNRKNDQNANKINFSNNNFEQPSSDCYVNYDAIIEEEDFFRNKQFNNFNNQNNILINKQESSPCVLPNNSCFKKKNYETNKNGSVFSGNSFSNKNDKNNCAASNIDKNNIHKPFLNKAYTNENAFGICNNNKIFPNNFEKEFLFKNTDYRSDFSRIKNDDHLKI
jgi:hypothetical protein